MQISPLRLKKSLSKIIASFCFYLPILKLTNRFINIFQPKKNTEGVLTFPFVKKRRSRNFQILTYHRVNDDYDPFFGAVPISVFEKQMDYVASNFHVCSLEDAIEMTRRKELPDNVIVVTFDDGYKDNYLNAFPILKKFSVPATIFLATDVISSGRVLWHDQVFSAFRETQELFLAGYGTLSIEYPLKTLNEKLTAQKEVLQFLRSLDEKERSFWIDRLIEKLKVDNRKERPDLMLTWEEVKIMYQNGISFGSHTVTHPILPRLTLDRIREEIYKSKEIIEEKLGVPIKTFAYPNGRKEDFNESIKNILKEAGYLCAVTTIFGVNENGQDLFELKRGGPWEAHLPTFAMKLNWYKFC